VTGEILKALFSPIAFLFPEAPSPKPQSQPVAVAVAPRRRGYGRIQVEGHPVFLKRSTLTEDGILYAAFALHSGEIAAIEEHWISDQITRLNPGSSGFDAFGITAVTFPALGVSGMPDKPPASEVVITAYDPGYTAETVTANYLIDGVPTTLDAISVGVVGGSFVSLVFPAISSNSLKPEAVTVTFTTSGAGTGELFFARPNGDGVWDGGVDVLISDGGTGFSDTVGGYGAAIFAQPNGAGRWDGGSTPSNVTIERYGTGYSAPVVEATWMVGSSVETLTATSVTIGDPGGFAVGNVIYPGIWYDNGRVTISEHLGLATQTADPLLLSGFPGTWTPQHRLDGVAYVALRLLGVPLQDFAEVYKFGVPTYRATIRASKIGDPRVSGYDPDNPDTFVWSDNAALVIMDYLTHQDGMRLPRSMIETGIADWIAAANYCDEEVPLLSGLTEPRYRLWVDYGFDEEPKSVLGRMLACIDGRLRLREDGAIVLDVGQFDCPTSCETFAAADILGAEGFRRGASKADLRNEIRAKYLSPGHKYQEQEADPLRDDASILIDGVQSATLDLTYCPSHRQARVVMKVASYRLNPEWMGTIVTNARGLRLLGKRYARFRITALGIDEVFFIQRADIDLLNARCTFEVISFPPEAYCFTTCEEGASPEHERPGDHGICVPTGACGVTIRAIGGGGGGGEGNGGGGGGFSELTLAVDAADWGERILFHVGEAGIGHVLEAFNLATDGGDSTVTGTLAAGAIAIVANGGIRGSIGGAGGTATGGDTNISGTTSSGGDGGLSGDGANENESPGGGGHEQVDGGIGSVTFEWVFDCPEGSEGGSEGSEGSGGSEGSEGGSEGSSGGEEEEDMILLEEFSPTGTGVVTFGAGGTIPQTYSHLLIVGSGRSSAGSSPGVGVGMTFNNDGGSNYDIMQWQLANASGGTNSQAAQASVPSAGFVPWSGATAGNIGNFKILIQAYALSTLFKGGLNEAVSIGATTIGASNIVRNGGFLWRSAAPITEIDLTLAAGNWEAGSKLSLYGLR